MDGGDRLRFRSLEGKLRVSSQVRTARKEGSEARARVVEKVKENPITAMPLTIRGNVAGGRTAPLSTCAADVEDSTPSTSARTLRLRRKHKEQAMNRMAQRCQTERRRWQPLLWRISLSHQLIWFKAFCPRIQ